jgi:hypothetical protein
LKLEIGGRQLFAGCSARTARLDDRIDRQKQRAGVHPSAETASFLQDRNGNIQWRSIPFLIHMALLQASYYPIEKRSHSNFDPQIAVAEG